LNEANACGPMKHNGRGLHYDGRVWIAITML